MVAPLASEQVCAWFSRGTGYVSVPIDLEPTLPCVLDSEGTGAPCATRVRLSHPVVLRPDLHHELVSLIRVQERGGDADAARGVEHVHRWATVVLLDLYGRVCL